MMRGERRRRLDVKDKGRDKDKCFPLCPIVMYDIVRHVILLSDHLSLLNLRVCYATKKQYYCCIRIFPNFHIL